MYASTNVYAVQMCLYTIAADYIGPLKHVNAHTDEDRYDLVALDAAGEPTLDLSDHPNRIYGRQYRD